MAGRKEMITNQLVADIHLSFSVLVCYFIFCCDFFVGILRGMRNAISSY